MDPIDPQNTQTTQTTRTTTTTPSERDDGSMLFGVSIRAWLALVIIGTVCAISIIFAIADIKAGHEELKIGEPLYTMAGMALGFYFGQKMAKGALG